MCETPLIAMNVVFPFHFASAFSIRLMGAKKGGLAE